MGPGAGAEGRPQGEATGLTAASLLSLPKPSLAGGMPPPRTGAHTGGSGHPRRGDDRLECGRQEVLTGVFQKDRNTGQSTCPQVLEARSCGHTAPAEAALPQAVTPPQGDERAAPVGAPKHRGDPGAFFTRPSQEASRQVPSWGARQALGLKEGLAVGVGGIVEMGGESGSASHDLC